MEKKKALFSLSGSIADIAWQVSKEGHQVRYGSKRGDIADGFVARSEKDAKWADLIVF